MIKEIIYNGSEFPRVIFTDLHFYISSTCTVLIVLLTISHILIMFYKKYGNKTDMPKEISDTVVNDYKDYLFLIFLVFGVLVAFFSTSAGFNLILPTLLKYL